MDMAALRDGNLAFAGTGAFAGLTMMPRRGVLVIGCADPRVEPEKVLGLELGDAAVIRNIGGRVTPPTLATLSGLIKVGRPAAGTTPSSAGRLGIDVILLHHTDCGILRLAEDLDALAGFLGVDPGLALGMHITNPYAAVAHDVATVRSQPLPGLRVWGVVYDVAPGLADITATPEEQQ